VRHPDRVGKIFAFAANTVTSGVKDGVEKNPTFVTFIERAGHQYQAAFNESWRSGTDRPTSPRSNNLYPGPQVVDDRFAQKSSEIKQDS
jgi:hypothetical protein